MEQLFADTCEIGALAERMQMEARRTLAAHGAGMAEPLVRYIQQEERRWGWVMERAHDLVAQLDRLSRPSERS
jgi:hypothetical protein